MSKKPTVLMILDGYGLNEKTEGNAIAQAKTPVMDGLMKDYPYVKGYASGLAVGLPDGQMGNSEVGHLNMGAGRIVYQELTRITKEIEDGDFFKNEALLDGMKNVKENNSALHLYGLLSDGGVHSHITHLYGLLEMAKKEGIENVYVHCFLDGRDTAPTSGKGFVEELEAKMKEIGVGQIASISGRYYAMDRDNRWDRVEKAYNALTKGEGETAASAVAALDASYAKDVTDEFFVPTVITKDGKPVATVNDNDTIIFFNFRPDRAREMTRAFCADEFDGFDRGARKNVTYICFTEYDVTIPNKEVAFKKVELKNTFGQFLAANGLKQARIAETEKYAHVTFFFNGGVEEPNEGEDRILVKSPKVATYDLQPEMSAPEVCDKLCTAIRSDKYDVIIINFANPDMVGHTGIMEAAVKAVETVDTCVGKAVDALKEVGGQMFICADHGNAEQLVDYETGAPFTAHTTNPVPFILVNADESYTLRENGCLADIIPTLIELMGMKQPEEMTGKSLLIKK
ncbi:MAG: 2,3-bisphosphoglycerate-independent phosphoglycerate mutase [Roseburia sp.]|uniref:2,3-bisphosphoglycerate-independent phosphoglycerate mutase n=1 Tax=Roseburia sp. 831b TaxID=1261635 RepID=UPI000950EC7B|nr:2,3-bisphosphoglycerate-independent phosphoglycerate mutase [Roseburia sp. 831b]MCI5919479.1 2,3-bisphosphoglycerate-independent phosphoglycerate mutase [Roseburia sp.]MDD6216474.1 2,3-bisphosphoglycerate-independent phosphoglycerate mutase [Roseburia sp.]MDY5883016.1 2,3-bisphosphoglycerate-independent phosphoglycerate mutase [Roseburia sp.]WVK73547.1 2,3-bisphosphoglycerate-independent phosphoglycerate mutase [Roseburia sp. 831b]